MIFNGWYTHECASTTKVVEVNRFADAQTNNTTESNRKMHDAEKTLTCLSVLVFLSHAMNSHQTNTLTWLLVFREMSTLGH